MTRLLDLSDAPAATLRWPWLLDVPAGRNGVLVKDTPAIAPRPMLWPCAYAPAEAAHREMRPAAPVPVLSVADALVGGEGAQVRKDGLYVWSRDVFPVYVREWIREEVVPERWAFEPAEPVRIDRAFAILHFTMMFGHFLLEVLPKLFVIERLARRGLRAPIIVPANAPNFVADIIREVLPGQQIVHYVPGRQHVAVRRLLLPGMMHAGDYAFHPAMNHDIDRYLDARGLGRGSRRLFLSRSRLGHETYRRLANADAVEAAAADLGLEIVHPETLPWRRQVELVAGAELLVGEFGSAMHLALFSPPGARVVTLNWINELQARIANLRGHDVGYIMAPDGAPRGFGDTGPGDFVIDPDELRGRLGGLGRGAP